MKNNHYSRKKRQLARLVEELRLKMEVSGQPPEMVHRIKLRIKFLLQELSGFVSKHQLKRMLGSFAIVFGFAASSNAQSFAAPVQNPFGLIQPVTDLHFPEMADLDNDGDLDILVGQLYGDIMYYENTGTASAPAYAAPVANPFGVVASMVIDAPALADLDGDGDFDLLIGQLYGVMTYQENIGTASNPSFAAGISLPFGLTATYNLALPDFADVDNDGDLDVLVGEYYANLQYFENTGTASAPSFAAPQANPFGLAAGYGLVFPEFADLDNDGDLDLFVGAYYGNIEYYMNTGTASSPVFFGPTVNPFGLTATSGYAIPVAVDLDNDGDIDLLVAEYYGAFQYFENISSAASIDETAINGSIDPNPFTDVVNFNFNQNVISAEFVNLAGQTILTVENPNVNVDVSSLETGVYIVKCMHQNGHTSTYKLQKQ